MRSLHPVVFSMVAVGEYADPDDVPTVKPRTLPGALPHGRGGPADDAATITVHLDADDLGGERARRWSTCTR